MGPLRPQRAVLSFRREQEMARVERIESLKVGKCEDVKVRKWEPEAKPEIGRYGDQLIQQRLEWEGGKVRRFEGVEEMRSREMLRSLRYLLFKMLS